MSKHLYVDIEANGLLYDLTEIHVVCTLLEEESRVKVWSNTDVSVMGFSWEGDLAECEDYINNHVNFCNDVLVGHNLYGFDAHVLGKIRGLSSRYSPFVVNGLDTMVASQLLFPETPCSLEYWSDKLVGSAPKVVHNDWSVLTANMIQRCINDVKITQQLHTHLSGRLSEVRDGKLVWKDALEREQNVLWIHTLQALHGVLFDQEYATELYNRLEQEYATLEEEIQHHLPWIRDSKIKPDVVAECYTKAGVVIKRVENFLGKDYPFGNGVGPFTKIGFKRVNLKSPKELKDTLLGLGWQPTEWNFKEQADGTRVNTSPKITEDSFDSLPGDGLGGKIKTLLTIKHRKSYLVNDGDVSKGAIPEVRSDGRLPSEAITCGTPTARYRHTGKIVNLPRPSSLYGKEIRRLFTVPPGKIMVGVDLKAIEARVMAHYTHSYDGGLFAGIVMSGDIHQFNADALGITRSEAKTFLYAICYGAGALKISRQLKCSKHKAEGLIKTFWKTNPGLKKLKDAIIQARQVHGGYIYGLDGRKVFIRSEHKALNTLIQHAAAVIFKEWMILVHREIIGYKGIGQIIAYHDELEFEVVDGNPALLEVFKDILIDKAKEVTVNFDLKVPVEVDIKVGRNYAEVH